MEEATTKLSKVLKPNGYSLTTPRLIVFKYLIGKEPVSVNTISQALTAHIDRASIYRTIGLFQSLNITQRHNIGWKYKVELSDMFAEHHHHFTCISCGTITPISEQTLEQFIDTLAKQHGFLPTDHQVEVQGYCSKCSATRSTVDER